MARMIRWAIVAALAASAAPAPAQVGTWTIRGTGTGTGVSFGANAACNRTVSVTRRARGTLSVAADGAYRAPAGQVCRRSAVIVPDEVGVWRPGRNGRVVLEPTNLDEQKEAIGQALSECTGASVVISRLRGRSWVKATADGQRLRGATRFSAAGRFSVRGVVCGFRVAGGGIFRGLPASALPSGRRAHASLPLVSAVVRAGLRAR